MSAELLFDLPWLEARLNWADLNALLADFQWGEGPRLPALERALRLGAHVVAHPEQLPSQLLARWPETSQPPPAEQRLRQQAITQLQKAGGAPPLAAGLLESEALLRTLLGHQSGINALAVLPDKRLASGSVDRTIQLWDPGSGGPGLVQVLFVADVAITALAFIPAASILVAGEAGGRLHWLQLPKPRIRPSSAPGKPG